MDVVETKEKCGINGHKLRGLRKLKGLSLSRLSELTGISKSYLSIIERDLHRNPSLGILEKLANFFELDVEYLVRRDGEVAVDTLAANHPKVTIKLEIEFPAGQISPWKLQQIIELVRNLNEES